MKKKLVHRYFKDFIKNCQMYQIETRNQGIFHMRFKFNYLNTPEKTKVYAAVETIKNTFKYHEVKIKKRELFPNEIEVYCISMFDDMNNTQPIISSIKKSFNKKTLKISHNNLDTKYIIAKEFPKDVINKIKDKESVDYGSLMSMFNLFKNDSNNRIKALKKFNAKQIFKNIEGRGVPIEDSNLQLFIDLIKIDYSIVDVLRNYDIEIKDSSNKSKLLSYFI